MDGRECPALSASSLAGTPDWCQRVSRRCRRSCGSSGGYSRFGTRGSSPGASPTPGAPAPPVPTPRSAGSSRDRDHRRAPPRRSARHPQGGDSPPPSCGRGPTVNLHRATEVHAGRRYEFSEVRDNGRPSFEGYKSRMPATGQILRTAQLEIVSPELVLVDPRLAADTRGLLSDPDDTVARPAQQSSPDSAEPPLPVGSVDPGSSADEEVVAALRRITELSEVEPPPPKRRSVRSLVVSRFSRTRRHRQ
jgi:hypothetical protein